MQIYSGIPLVWTLSAGGHHGRYPSVPVRNNLGKRNGPFENDLQWPDQLRRQLLEEITRHLGPLPHEVAETAPGVHWLTGLTIFCDWIGSNTDWLPLHPEQPLRDHYTPEAAASMATSALDLIGWHRRTVTPGLSFSALFSSSGMEDFKPRALQEALIALAGAPGLYIIEAPMGMGKTEAALAAAYRRWTEGTKRGLYFALPTQLTSNLIHDRITGFLDHAIADESTQNLVHGNAWLRENRIRRFSPDDASIKDTGAREACQWFSSSRKPLLAPFGTGTIDQALMAAISARHSALRLFALSGKVVVIDEVHSYDPYTSALVDQLVSWLLNPLPIGVKIVDYSLIISILRK